MGLKYISIKLKLSLFCCLAIQSVFGNMLVFRGLCMVKGPVEGADKKGYAIAMEKLGMIGDEVYGIPVYAYWSSESGVSSPCLGYGWRLPIADSRNSWGQALRKLHFQRLNCRIFANRAKSADTPV